MHRECSPEDEAGVREGIAAYFPEPNGPTRRIVACMFTTSPDEHFVLARPPAVDNAFIAAGSSGHGYRFCSVIGRIMADFYLGEEGSEWWRGSGWGRRGGDGVAYSWRQVAIRSRCSNARHEVAS